MVEVGASLMEPQLFVDRSAALGFQTEVFGSGAY
jgi:hypothetical protein